MVVELMDGLMIVLLKSYTYHFIRTILSVPFCPYTILSIPFCRYHFLLEPYYSSFCDSVAAVSAALFFIKQILFCIVLFVVGDSHDVMPTTTFDSGLGSVHYKDCCTSPYHPSPIPSTENLQQGHLEQGLPQVTPPLKQEDLDSSKQMVEVINGWVNGCFCDLS